MLINFSVENVLSFRAREVFSMVPGKGTLKSEHINETIGKKRTLKMAFIFGANASGKSNLISAIELAQALILTPSNSNSFIHYSKFKLDKDYLTQNSRMEFELQCNKKNYAYGFIFNNYEIIEEWLYDITKSEQFIFKRINKKFDFEKNLSKDHFAIFLSEKTRSNQLFLNELNGLEAVRLKTYPDLFNIINWFRHTLKVITPETSLKEYILLGLNHEKFAKQLSIALQYFDTGIELVYLAKIDIKEINLDDKLLNEMKSALLDTKGVLLFHDKKLYLINKQEDELKASQVKTRHKDEYNNNIIDFDIIEESDGTQRLIELLPMLFDYSMGDKLFIIDEPERSLHPNLIYDFIQQYIQLSKDKNNQLIMATHESSLLTQKLLRKDEIWFIAKKQGSSHISALEEYKVRFDKQIRSAYLQGRFKAVPEFKGTIGIGEDGDA